MAGEAAGPLWGSFQVAASPLPLRAPPRAGGLEPLRLLSKGKQRVLPGFITTKTGDLESIDDLKRKFDEASKYADIDQLGIAPQCGFASTEEGNNITFDDQRRKLDLVVRTAEEIWGGV